MQRIGGHQATTEIEGLEHRAEGDDLVLFVVDLCLGDDDALCVGERGEQVDRATVVLDRTTQALGIDRDRPKRRCRRILVVGVLFGRDLLGYLGRCLDPFPPGRELADDDLVDHRVELVTLDRPQHPLDGGERRSNESSGLWRATGVEAHQQLLVQVFRPLSSVGQLRASNVGVGPWDGGDGPSYGAAYGGSNDYIGSATKGTSSLL